MGHSHSRNLVFSLWDAFFFSIMVGAGESYLPAFALEVGFSETLTGLISSVPLAVGAVIQLLTPFGLRYVGSAKKWVVVAALVQALSLLPLVFWSQLGFHHPAFLFLAVSIYWGAGFAGGPVWNRWMADLVPDHLTAGFFAKRLRITQYGILFGLIASGIALHNKIGFGFFTSTFSSLFLVAFLARASSTLMLSQKTAGLQDVDSHDHLVEVLKSIKKSVFEKRLLLFLFLFGCAIFISSPFVNPFLLKQMKLDFQEYTLALIALFAGKVIGYTVTHRKLSHWPQERVLLFGGLGIAPLPGLWMYCSGVETAVALQLVSGLFWGIYESALTLILFRRVSSSAKVSLLSILNFLQCGAILLGSLFGGWLLKLGGETPGAYVQVFTWSSSLRVLIVLGFMVVGLQPKRPRDSETVPAASLHEKGV